jgi:crotonobetainyl-CoA:carnitine CoA-transferase CaiB-like acyl-CoA transferase
MSSSALKHIRICDLSGQLAGAGSTRILAAFGAQVIRVEDPVTKGLWDIVRQLGPAINGDTSHEGGSGFNNHNVEKLGITLNLRTARGRELLAELVRVSDAVTENFSAKVMTKLGFGYEQLRAIRPDIVYVSNCGFGQVGPYRTFRTWGPVVQAVSGLTFSSGLPDQEPAGWGYSYMDHTGAYMMAIALLSALLHRSRTGQGQWIDMSCTEAGATLNGPALLDWTVNGRPLRREGMPNSNRSQYPLMAPHGVYATSEADQWVAIACRNDEDWASLRSVLGGTPPEDRFDDLDGLDAYVTAWTSGSTRAEIVDRLRSLGIPCAPVARPSERCDHDPRTAAWGLWPTAHHTKHGPIRVDGLPVHLSATDWSIEHAGPLLGEHNEFVLGDILGLSSADIAKLADEGVI